MFKFVSKKKIAALFAGVIALIATVSLAVSPSFAAMPYSEYLNGSVSYGVYMAKSETSLNLLKQNVTFNAVNFPDTNSYPDLNYRSTVTTELTVANPAESAVTATMVVPEISRPGYYGNVGEVTPPVIKVNGESVTPTVRHLNGEDFYRGKAVEIPEDYCRDNFYDPDMPVHAYKLTVENDAYSQLKGDLITDFTKARYISDGADCFSCNYSQGEDNLFYIIGDNTAVDFSALSLYAYNNYDLVKIPDRFAVEEQSQTTLKELILSFKNEYGEVSDVDWYNGIAENFSNNECALRMSELRNIYFKQCYVYSAEIPAGGSIQTSVTSPVYPDVFKSSGIYEYDYNTQSTESWSGCGKFEIEVVTDFYVLNCPTEFEKTDTGFKANYSVPPYGSVCFSLSAKQITASGTYKDETTIEDIAVAITVFIIIRFLLFVIGGGISFAVLMVKKHKRV